MINPLLPHPYLWLPSPVPGSLPPFLLFPAFIPNCSERGLSRDRPLPPMLSTSSFSSLVVLCVTAAAAAAPAASPPPPSPSRASIHMKKVGSSLGNRACLRGKIPECLLHLGKLKVTWSSSESHRIVPHGTEVLPTPRH